MGWNLLLIQDIRFWVLRVFHLQWWMGWADSHMRSLQKVQGKCILSNEMKKTMTGLQNLFAPNKLVHTLISLSYELSEPPSYKRPLS